MSNWEGYAVSVNCGEPLGCYQGTILQADGNTITLTKAFRNGFPYPKSQVTLNAADIKELKIIEARSQPSEQPSSTVAVTKNKKTTRATVCESLQANHSNNNNTGPAVGSGGNKATRGVARSKPIDITPARNKTSTHQGSGGGLPGSTPKRANLSSGTAAARRRNEACFGAAASPADEDFDFEGNLALFDKRALATQLRNKPDLLRQTEDSKYRHDENVLGGSAPELSSISVPAALRAPRDYLTDAGLRVPALSSPARGQAYRLLQKSNAWSTSLVLLARGLADVCLRVAGGGRRLDARNAHQRPRAAALIQPSAAPARAAAAAARLLHAHGAAAHVYCVQGAPDPALTEELHMCHESGVPVHFRLDTVPAPDIVILALFDPVSAAAPADVGAALRWARGARAHVVALEPSPDAWGGAALARASVAALLPPLLPAELGQLYLVNLAPPPGVFGELGVKYRPPFGAVSAMPLHAPDPDD